MWKKIVSISLSMLLFVSVNFCVAECACAASEHSDGDHHGSGPEKHDAGSLCCSSLISDQIPSGNSFGSPLLKSRVLTGFIATGSFFVPSSFDHPQYRAEFPPGTSPPAVFLSTYFTHAPPAIL